ncbi:helix-turn-helix domain-containing protein [Stieleria varia]|uniref:Helix-turn-helix domain protein n=1 Tax=Stieleria varia TaxID=2528005 RepID=A0A5C6AGQ3_9BACT|nr:helix-turn-helix domain-containing protein [Stieleria varia]TWT98607.1 Helix-turn-helix domain protein [Stieleria varia]
MPNYLSLEEAAAKLGVPTDRLVELRSQGQIRGFKDGSSWKFPDTEIDRLADELAMDGVGSGELVDFGGGIGSIIGDDEGTDDGAGSDLGIGGEPLKEGSTGGSDVNLIANASEDGSDVSLVPSGSGIELDDDDDLLFDDDSMNLVEIDSAELRLDDPAILHDSDESIDLAIDPKEGSTGPVARKDIDDALAESASSLSLEGESSDESKSDLSFSGLADDDSDDAMIGDDSGSIDALADDDLGLASAGASSLELMNDLDAPTGGDNPIRSSGADVLSELDLLSAEQSGSGLISGDSESLLSSSGLGSSLSSGVLAEMDDALDSDDDLVIADDDADLMLDSVSDISVAGDSGINLMSPSDSGLSLESEPLDLAGSSISALDLGAELAEGSDISGSAISSGDGSAVDFQSDEEFQLSPSGVGLEIESDSSSQVIEIEDTEAVGEAVVFDDDFGDAVPVGDAAGFAAGGASMDAFGDGMPVGQATPVAVDPMGEPVQPDMMMEEEVAASPRASVGGFEVPFTLLQCVVLLLIMMILSLGGMLMTDLVRNMWAYSETTAPVSSLTDALIGLMGWDS